jgi:hypothetical protein
MRILKWLENKNYVCSLVREFLILNCWQSLATDRRPIFVVLLYLVEKSIANNRNNLPGGQQMPFNCTDFIVSGRFHIPIILFIAVF